MEKPAVCRGGFLLSQCEALNDSSVNPYRDWALTGWSCARCSIPRGTQGLGIARSAGLQCRGGQPLAECRATPDLPGAPLLGSRRPGWNCAHCCFLPGTQLPLVET